MESTPRRRSKSVLGRWCTGQRAGDPRSCVPGGVSVAAPRWLSRHPKKRCCRARRELRQLPEIPSHRNEAAVGQRIRARRHSPTIRDVLACRRAAVAPRGCRALEAAKHSHGRHLGDPANASRPYHSTLGGVCDHKPVPAIRCPAVWHLHAKKIRARVCASHASVRVDVRAYYPIATQRTRRHTANTHTARANASPEEAGCCHEHWERRRRSGCRKLSTATHAESTTLRWSMCKYSSGSEATL